MNSSLKKTILIFSANPKDTRRLRPDEEIREIEEALRDSESPNLFELKTSLATPVADLQTLLLRHKPHIVHFCGHGETDGLLFEDVTGRKQQVPVEALAELFKLCGQSIECVVLNACYSKPQAEAIHQYIPCVIGMDRNIGDKAAMLFAAGFYTALGNGRLYPEAFEFGCNRIGLHNIPEDSTPVILVRDDVVAHPSSRTNPYRGLSAFREEDEAYFFGREAYTAKILDAMRQSSFTAILGASGSGKSSIVYAGVIPHLRRGELTSPEKQKEDSWLITTFRPGEHPFKAISVALLPFLESELQEVDRLVEINKLTGALKAGQLSFSDLLERIQTKHSGPHILFFIDQFEEIFSLCEDAKERQSFLDKLLECLKRPESTKLSVIITLRSDFLGHCNSLPELSHLIAEHEIIIPAMNEEELRHAIAEPANVAGLPLSEEVVDLLIEQSAGREGALPLLEFALTRIWEGMTNGIKPADTLKQIGGVGGALANKAQDLFDSLNEAEQKIARRAFLAMIRLGEGTKDTRRRVNIDNNIVACNNDSQEVRRILNHFAHPGARLITLADGNAEITHEALFDHWEALKFWLDTSRNDLRFHRRLADAAQHWESLQRPDGSLWRPPDLDLLKQYHHRNQQDMTALQVAFFQESERNEKRKRFHKKVIRGILVSLMVIVIIFWFSAREERDRANSASEIAKNTAQMAQENAELAKEIAQFAQERYKEERALLAQNYWSQAIKAKEDGDWVKASHYFANSAKYEEDESTIKNCILNIQDYTRRSFLLAKVNSPEFKKMFPKNDDDLLIVWDSNIAQVMHRKDKKPESPPLRHDATIYGGILTKDRLRALTWGAS